MAGKTEVLGIAELQKQFAKLKDMKRGAARIAVAGGRVLRKQAKQNAQAQGLRKTGSLIKNIVIKRERTPDGVAEYHLGVRHGRSLTKKTKKATAYLAVSGKTGRIVERYKDDPYYWKFHEFGYVAVGGRTIRGGTKRRNAERERRLTAGEATRVPARPFIGPALDMAKEEAIKAMEQQMITELEKQTKA